MDDSFPGVSMAVPQDEDEIYALLLGLHQENGVFSVSEPRVRGFIRACTQQEDGVFGFIGLIRESTIEASVGLELTQWWYTDEWSLSEKWCFVHPGHRRKNHARRLVDFSKWCADRLAVPLLMGIISTQRTEAKERLYQRKMVRVGGMFMHGSTAPIVTGAHNGQQDHHH